MENTRDKFATVIKTLRKSGITCHLFGGWAEELLDLREPRQHGDIDLIYCDENFRQFDSVLQTLPEFAEVPLKRFRHKRAFQFLGTLCEVTLVQGPEERPTTHFWGDVPYVWGIPLLHEEPVQIGMEPISVVSQANLEEYRMRHKATEPHRWREPQSLEPYT